MDKILFSYAVVFYIIFSSIAQAGIDCNNLTSVCCNRPVVLTCKAPQLPIQWKSLDCIPQLFEDIVLDGNSDIDTTIEDTNGAFIATVVDITNDNFVTTTLKFFPNSSYERQCRIRCEYGNTNGNSPENQDCDINYEYKSKCTWCRVNL